MVMKSPDCAQGKCKACTREDAAWDGEQEQTTDCGCECHAVQCRVFIGSDRCELEQSHDGYHRTTWADRVSVFWKGDEPYSHGNATQQPQDRFSARNSGRTGVRTSEPHNGSEGRNSKQGDQ